MLFNSIKRLPSYPIYFLLFSISSTLHAQSYWQTQGHIAKITVSFPQAKKPALGTLNIDWDPKANCRPTIGFILTHDNNLGKYKGNQWASENMMVTIGKRQWTGKTLIASYSGGQEVMMQAPDDLINSINNENDILVKLFSDSPTFSFPLSGAARAIDQARINCK
jgi:hypothetical protein